MRKARTVVAALAVVSLAAFAGCGAGGADSEEDNPWAADIQRQYERTDHALVKSILEDGKITDAEIEEFMAEYNTCLAEYGLFATYDRENRYETLVDQYSRHTGEEMQQYNEGCRESSGYYDLIPLDEEILGNPEHLSADEQHRLIYDCRKRHGLIDEGMTFEEYKDILMPQWDGTGENPFENGVFGKYYTDADSEATQQWDACESDPSN